MTVFATLTGLTYHGRYRLRMAEDLKPAQELVASVIKAVHAVHASTAGINALHAQQLFAPVIEVSHAMPVSTACKLHMT